MLSSNRFFGNAGRSRWMAGLTQQAYTGALQDWTRTEVAAAMPKTAAVPAGYGGNALALPREAGAFASYSGFRYELGADVVLDGAHVYDLMLQWGADLVADMPGLGVVQATPAWDWQADVALAALAPFDATLTWGLAVSGSLDAVAPLEVTLGYGIELLAAVAALAPLEVTLGYGIELAGDFAGGAVLPALGLGYGFDLATGAGLYGLGVWGASDAADAGEMTPDGIAAATVQALQAVQIPVNVKRINDVSIDGTGVPGDGWGPA